MHHSWKSEFYRQVKADLAMLRTLQKAGIITMAEEVRFRDPLDGRTYAQTKAPPFTAEQQAVWQQMENHSFSANTSTGRQPDLITGVTQTSAHKILLHGVTGSGKTEIYLRAIAATLAQGKQAIVLCRRLL
ncbi:MAG: hypothetical protein R2932_07650 [Caldilineaceae bacterium]